MIVDFSVKGFSPFNKKVVLSFITDDRLKGKKDHVFNVKADGEDFTLLKTCIIIGDNDVGKSRLLSVMYKTLNLLKNISYGIHSNNVISDKIMTAGVTSNDNCYVLAQGDVCKASLRFIINNTLYKLSVKYDNQGLIKITLYKSANGKWRNIVNWKITAGGSDAITPRKDFNIVSDFLCSDDHYRIENWCNDILNMSISSQKTDILRYFTLNSEIYKNKRTGLFDQFDNLGMLVSKLDRQPMFKVNSNSNNSLKYVETGEHITVSNNLVSYDLFEKSTGHQNKVFLAIYLEMIYSKDKFNLPTFAFVDNFNDVRPEVINRFIYLASINPSNSQSIIVTNNYDFLKNIDEINNEGVRADSVWFIEAIDDVTDLCSLSNFNNGVVDNVYNKYVCGRYGATTWLPILI